MTINMEVTSGIACVTLDRPHAMNAITRDMHEQMRDMWSEINANASITAVVITGKGSKAFCSGADIGTLLPFLSDAARTECDAGDLGGISREPPTYKPVIAAINGICMAGGLEIALACDLRIAEEHSVFGLPEVRWGVIAGAGGVTRLTRMIPEAVAMDMLLTGRTIDADRALQLGLISDIVERGTVMQHAMDKAEQISRHGPIAVRMTKEVARRGQDMGLHAALELERVAFRRVMLSADSKEGIAAFVEKRSPDYKGV